MIRSAAARVLSADEFADLQAHGEDVVTSTSLPTVHTGGDRIELRRSAAGESDRYELVLNPLSSITGSTRRPEAPLTSFTVPAGFSLVSFAGRFVGDGNTDLLLQFTRGAETFYMVVEPSAEEGAASEVAGPVDAHASGGASAGANQSPLSAPPPPPTGPGGSQVTAEVHAAPPVSAAPSDYEHSDDYLRGI